MSNRYVVLPGSSSTQWYIHDSQAIPPTVSIATCTKKTNAELIVAALNKYAAAHVSLSAHGVSSG